MRHYTESNGEKTLYYISILALSFQALPLFRFNLANGVVKFVLGRQ